jgi:hypothetical protein
MENVFYGENATDYTIPMTNATTEYSQRLPEGVKAIEIQCRDGTDIQFSFSKGLVAGTNGASSPVEPYRTLKSGTVYFKEMLYLNATTLYVACGSSGKTVEVRCWL